MSMVAHKQTPIHSDKGPQQREKHDSLLAAATHYQPKRDIEKDWICQSFKGT